MKIVNLIGISLLMLQANAYGALVIDPARCGHDNLNPGSPSELAGTAWGRNQWLKVCQPDRYDTVFPNEDYRGPLAAGKVMYPTYAKITGTGANGEVMFADTGYRAPTTPPPSPGDAACVVPAPNRFVGLCTASCVTGDTLIDAENSRPQIAKFNTDRREKVQVPQFSQGSVLLQPMPVKNQIKDMMDAHQEVFVISTVSGATVKASEHHPFLMASGYMARSSQLRVGDSLVQVNGKADPIVSISKEMIFGKLYNVSVDTTDRRKSMYVVNGLISGDRKIQDEQVSEFNRAVLREVAFELGK